MKRPVIRCLALTAFLVVSSAVCAQRTAPVNGTATLIVGDNDNITFRDARARCIEMAKAEAIKQRFGELVSSDVVSSYSESNGERNSSQYMDVTESSAKGTWLGDSRDPEISVLYVDGKLHFKAEVWGEAREIVQSQIDLKWDIMRNKDEQRKEKTTVFNSGDRIFVDFRTPVDGYLAIYLVEDNGEASCLLPYHPDATGRFSVQSGYQYMFFDKQYSYNKYHYNPTTKQAETSAQIVLVFSPNPFTKCNDISRGPKYAPYVPDKDLHKWLLRIQKEDSEMVVNRKWITIKNEKVN